jgi:hypothetical protein
MRRLIACTFIVVAVVSLVGCLPVELTYPSPQVLRIGVPVTLSPSIKGVAATFKVSPALPTGLTLNATTGVISGSPGQERAQANYVIRASNTLGSTTFTLVLTVLPPPPSGLQNPSPQALTVGNPVDLQPTVTGSVTSYAVAPALPDGFVLNTSTGRISGIASTESALATYTITAANAGGSTAFDLAISIGAATPLPGHLKFYTEVDNPQIFSFQTGTQDALTFLGQKDPSGAALTISNLFMRTPAGEQSQIVNDALGRPVLARLSDGTRISFEWLSDTRVKATMTTANAVANFSTEFDLTQPAALATSVREAARAAPLSSTPPVSMADTNAAVQQLANAAAVPGATIKVNVTSFGAPISDAEVIVGVVPVSNLSAAATYAAQEVAPGEYTTPFVNFPSAIPPSTVQDVCRASQKAAAAQCAIGTPVSTFMTKGGCFALAGGLALLIGPEAFLVVPSCQSLFTQTAIACATVQSTGDGRQFCALIENLVELLDGDGADVRVFVRKDGYQNSATLHVPNGLPLAEVNVELPLPKFLHANISDVGKTTLTTRLNGEVTRVCNYDTVAPVGLTVLFTGSTPRALLVNSTFRHSLTSGTCTQVIDGSLPSAPREIALQQSGNSLSGSAQFNGNEVSVSATRENTRVHGTINESVRLVVNDGPFTHTFETKTTMHFDAR